jgi:hypothetical protein
MGDRIESLALRLEVGRRVLAQLLWALLSVYCVADLSVFAVGVSMRQGE